jgi:hypothetical protein
LKSTVKWLGKELSKEGSRMRIERVSLFKNIKPPENKKELSSLLHMLNYRGMYISTHAGILELLSRLVRKTQGSNGVKSNNICMGKGAEDIRKQNLC